jgi:hypothetical protein
MLTRLPALSLVAAPALAASCLLPSAFCFLLSAYCPLPLAAGRRSSTRPALKNAHE